MEPNVFKKSFCRYFLRGLCLFEAKECVFAHGIADLTYKLYKEGEIVEYDYHAKNEINQREVIKGPRVYKNLFEFQMELPEEKMKYSLEQINEDKIIRTEVRNAMHRALFEQFIELLQESYLNQEMTEDFLLREYTRVGFNKLMTRISFVHLTQHLCDGLNSNYYKESINKKTVIKKKAPLEKINTFYKEKYNEAILLKLESENELKKYLSLVERPMGIPQIHIILKQQKISWHEYISKLLGEEIAQLKIEDLVQEAIKFVRFSFSEHNKPLEWSNIFEHLSKKFKCNNGNLINQVKNYLLLEGFLFLYFPMVHIIIHFEFITTNEKDVCHCPFQEPYDLVEIMEMCHNIEINTQYKKELLVNESIDIIDMASLLFCIPYLFSSKTLGVDLEGRLRKNGYIEMIQLNNGRNTFLIDIYQMDLNGDIHTFELLKKILRNLMVDEHIEKIFHDCRHDSLALHEFIGTCIKNVFDTSAVETYIGQLFLYREMHKSCLEQKESIEINGLNKEFELLFKITKETLLTANNIRTLGLNEILKRYEAPHGINQNKEKFHKMWSEGQTTFFDERPLHPEFREYCIKDVLDLIHVKNKMSNELKDINMAKWISSHYVEYGYSILNKNETEKIKKPI